MSKYKKENKEYTIRSINLKLVLTEELIEKINGEFDTFSNLYDIGVNRYARLPDPGMINQKSQIINQKS